MHIRVCVFLLRNSLSIAPNSRTIPTHMSYIEKRHVANLFGDILRAVANKTSHFIPLIYNDTRFDRLPTKSILDKIFSTWPDLKTTSTIFLSKS